MSATFTQWTPTLAPGIDPDSRIGKTLKAIAEQWEAAHKTSLDLRGNAIRRYEIFDLHSTEAGKIRTLRQQRAMEFTAARDELLDRIKHAREGVREEITNERSVIDATYHAKIAHLRFWNVIRHTKAKAGHMRRLAGHHIGLALHPVSLRTMRKRDVYRASLRVHANQFMLSDGILHRAQKAHTREAWFGPMRPIPTPAPPINPTP